MAPKVAKGAEGAQMVPRVANKDTGGGASGQQENGRWRQRPTRKPKGASEANKKIGEANKKIGEANKD